MVRKCDTLAELQAYDFPGSSFTNTKICGAAVALTGNAPSAAGAGDGSVELTFTGTTEVKSLVYAADCGRMLVVT